MLRSHSNSKNRHCGKVTTKNLEKSILPLHRFLAVKIQTAVSSRGTNSFHTQLLECSPAPAAILRESTNASQAPQTPPRMDLISNPKCKFRTLNGMLQMAGEPSNPSLRFSGKCKRSVQLHVWHSLVLAICVLEQVYSKQGTKTKKTLGSGVQNR